MEICKRLQQTCSNVCRKLAVMFAASLQEAFHIWACEKLQQANSKPNLHGKMLYVCSNGYFFAIFAVDNLQ